MDTNLLGGFRSSAGTGPRCVAMPFSRRASGTTRGAGTDSPPRLAPRSGEGDVLPRRPRGSAAPPSAPGSLPGRGAGAPTSAGKTSAAPCSPVRRRWARTRRHERIGRRVRPAGARCAPSPPRARIVLVEVEVPSSRRDGEGRVRGRRSGGPARPRVPSREPDHLHLLLARGRPMGRHRLRRRRRV